ncbi:hypothetical protein Bpfe_007937 [Biomphalaria pfeifferi]|uniref:Uncharacterized protein n=1 Tax=Biomphalaria pfeifferi TaxID=112525 RepID=A0AAD8FF58_BIOPF|nr:hypothetical protein Bpfe_007937 [Biomphalaria pfeifferi]
MFTVKVSQYSGQSRGDTNAPSYNMFTVKVSQYSGQRRGDTNAPSYNMFTVKVSQYSGQSRGDTNAPSYNMFTVKVSQYSTIFELLLDVLCLRRTPAELLGRTVRQDAIKGSNPTPQQRERINNLTTFFVPRCYRDLLQGNRGSL